MNRIASYLPQRIERGSPTWWAWMLLGIGLFLGITIGTVLCAASIGKSSDMQTSMERVADELQDRLHHHRMFE